MRFRTRTSPKQTGVGIILYMLVHAFDVHPDYVTAILHLSDVFGTPVSYRDTNTQDHVGLT